MFVCVCACECICALLYVIIRGKFVDDTNTACNNLKSSEEIKRKREGHTPSEFIAQIGRRTHRVLRVNSLISYLNREISSVHLVRSLTRALVHLLLFIPFDTRNRIAIVR